MNTFIWTLHAMVSFIFLYSGICKAYLEEDVLVKKGQTGVEGLPRLFIKFIGISEILGAVGLILPKLLNIYPILTPISALCLGLIMVPAGVIHYRRNEYKNVVLNIVIFLICIAIAYYSLKK